MAGEHNPTCDFMTWDEPLTKPVKNAERRSSEEPAEAKAFIARILPVGKRKRRMNRQAVVIGAGPCRL